jgi:hypothetical protein
MSKRFIMACAELIVDVHHHYMPVQLFDRLAAGGKRSSPRNQSDAAPIAQDLGLISKRWTKPGHGIDPPDQVQVMV